jgi:hypothetical protein
MELTRHDIWQSDCISLYDFRSALNPFGPRNFFAFCVTVGRFMRYG